jgi:hypothetical protein
MVNPIETAAHAAIGRAVLACQALEALFALSVRLQFAQSSADQLTDITPLEKNFSKPPMKRLLQELKQHIDVSAEFELRVTDLIDRRHKLIHRWVIEERLPDSPESFKKISEFASSIEHDAIQMFHFLHDGFLAWVKKFPELANPRPGEEKAWESTVPEALRSLSIRKTK